MLFYSYVEPKIANPETRCACTSAVLVLTPRALSINRDAHGHFLREVWSGVMGFNRNDEALMRDIVQPMMLCALDPQSAPLPDPSWTTDHNLWDYRS